MNEMDGTERAWNDANKQVNAVKKVKGNRKERKQNGDKVRG